MDYTTLITAEHANKPKFAAMIDAVANGIGAITALIQTIPDEYDLDEAVGVQLDTVGEWVGQARVVPNVLTLSYFGFSEVGGGTDGTQQPFGELTNPSIGAPFYDLGDPLGSSATLNDAQYRTILRAAIIRNQYDGTLASLEQALEDVFGCPCAVADAGTKSISILVSEPQSAVIQALIANYDILPRPAGIAISAVTYAESLETESGLTLETESGENIII